MRKEAMHLTGAQFTQAAFQVLTPMVLVRYLSPSDFGTYRLFWLGVSTVMIFAPLGMPRSLLFFIPSSPLEKQKKYVQQTVFYMLMAGVIATISLFVVLGLLPNSFQSLLVAHHVAVPFFIMLWVFSCLLDFLPIAAQQISFQANMDLLFGVMRTAFVVMAAMIYGDFEHIIYALLILVQLRSGMLVYYSIARWGTPVWKIDRILFREQLGYAIPFGLADAVYSLRLQVQNWIVAYYFDQAVFAAFSIAATSVMPFNLVRKSISNIVLARMSKFIGGNDKKNALSINQVGNVLVNCVLYPLIVFSFIYANEIIEMLFTAAYYDSVSVMRVYLIQQLISLELGSFMASLRQGSFVLIYNIIGVFLSILACLLGVYFYGFVGAAIGGCFMTALAMSIDVFRISVVLEKNIASIQQWRSLLVLLFSSCVAGLLSMLTVNSFAFSSTILRLLSAIVILFGLYLFFLKCFNHWWIVDKILGRRGTDG